MCQLGKEIKEILAIPDEPIVGVRTWIAEDNNLFGINNQPWDGKNCSGDIDRWISYIPLGVYAWSNYNNYYYYNNFNNYYNNYNNYNNYYYNNYYDYNYYDYNNNYYNNYHCIMGEVNLFGRIKQHELGYRAEQASVKSLFLLDHMKGRDKKFIIESNNKIVKISEKYSIPTMTEFEYLAL